MTLSYTDKFAWYGLRENPTYDQLLSTVRKPVRIPIPSREAKWYATGIYRALLLDAANNLHDHQQKDLRYDAEGNFLPSAAARGSQPSVAGDDPAWKEHDRFNEALDQEEAHNLAMKAMHQEKQAQTASLRQQQLSSYGPSMVHPTLEAHHRDLEDKNVPHPAPIPKLSMAKASWPSTNREYIAAGQPQAPEFPTFEQLNMGQDKRYKHGLPGSMNKQSYETLRKNMLG
jgi:hypothetical protein